MQEIEQKENRIPLPPKASSSLRFLIYGVGANAAEMERLASPVVLREPELKSQELLRRFP
jgi:hypothetical protein